MLSQAVESGTLSAISERSEAVLRSDITCVIVGTPDRADRSINLTFVKDPCQDIGAAMCAKKKEWAFSKLCTRAHTQQGTHRVEDPSPSSHRSEPRPDRLFRQWIW